MEALATLSKVVTRRNSKTPQNWPPKDGKIYRRWLLHGHTCADCQQFCACLKKRCWFATIARPDAQWSCGECLPRPNPAIPSAPVQPRGSREREIRELEGLYLAVSE